MTTAKYQRAYRARHPTSVKIAASNLKAKWMSLICAIGYDKCSRCGYNKCFDAIDFHHPGTKQWKISSLMRYAITPPRIRELLDTIPLCSNCHREKHHEEV